MAAYSNILAWRIPWTEEPGGYSPKGCKESHTIEMIMHIADFSCMERLSIYYLSWAALWKRKSPFDLFYSLGKEYDIHVAYSIQQIFVTSEYYCMKAFLKALSGILIPGPPELSPLVWDDWGLKQAGVCVLVVQSCLTLWPCGL